MSLTSFLLSKSSEVVDTELDDLFKAAPRATNTAHKKSGHDAPSTTGKQKKLKRKTISDADAAAEAGPSTATSAKRLKSEAQPTTTTAIAAPFKSKSASKSSGKDSASQSSKQKTTSKQKKKALTPPSSTDSDEEEDDDDENSDIENRYLAQRAKKEQVVKAGKGKEDEEAGSDSEDLEDEVESEDDAEVDDDDEDEDEDDGEAKSAPSDSDDDEEEGSEPPVHESLLKDKQSKNSSGKNSKKKYVPEDETPEMRDRRTIFVGNLPIAVAQKRPLQKQLQRHILSFVPTAKIESTRFRSVPFQNPTSKLPGSDDEDDTPSSTTKKPHHPHQQHSTDKPTNHSTTRAQSWRTTSSSHDEETVKKDEKSYLTPNQKKKIAFINHQFHSTADSVNCYIVFAHPIPVEHQAKNVPAPPDVMDPYEAARQAVEKGNNSLFMERVVRVDRVAVRAKGAPEVGEGQGEVGVGAAAMGDADPKFTVFVGNLDFASKEEDVRVFFESLVEKEKGVAAKDGMDVDGEENEKRGSWVVRVRIVRDKGTQLGKGFAYVQFSDKECVDEILALEESKLKFARRKLRVQRCKTIPGTSFKVKSTPSSSKSKSQPSSSTSSSSTTKKPVRNGPPTPIIVPKGDPTLGDRLAHLPKAVRKDVKRNDGDRVARRLAKKKARMAMGPPKSAAAASSNPNTDGVRERKRSSTGSQKRAEGKLGGNSGKKTGKRRVRSEKMAMKRNGKKQ